MKTPTVAFHHFGCKLNFAESSSISRQFREKGYQLADFHEQADIYVISTCVVTVAAERKCRAAIRQAHKLNPAARIAVIGCFPELKADEISAMEGVSLVLGNGSKFSLAEQIEHVGDDHQPYHSGAGGLTEFIPSFSYGDRTRSFLKIQDGCDYYCAYCTIPLVRGHSRSDTISNVLKNVDDIIRAGVKEIVLTGVNIGEFGRNKQETFFDLIFEMNRILGIPRVRISSIEPDLLTDAIIEFIADSENFMPHFHIPLQSGTDEILKAMKRKYNTAFYASRIRKIRSLLPYACIAADVIVGFPGESEDDFLQTTRFLKDLDISYMHVFTYSRRENTLAVKLPDQVQDKIRKERSELLHKLSEEKKIGFYKGNMGRTSHVLFESDNSGGFMHGFTENYIRVKTKFDPEKINSIVEVRLDNLQNDCTFVV